MYNPRTMTKRIGISMAEFNRLNELVDQRNATVAWNDRDPETFEYYYLNKSTWKVRHKYYVKGVGWCDKEYVETTPEEEGLLL